ncbi:MAG: bifunctional phosphopantothenoylcysteine decarboxylase/phosphopantothenate--cysteine ligase CoaBC [Sphingosinicella sp.]
MRGKKILLIVGGGIAAYKACELIRLIRAEGGEVRCVLTKGGAQFITPMTLAALSEQPVHTSLFDLKDEVEMGHIQLSREADLVVVCPATADLIAKMAAGIADDLASTLLLATDKPVVAVPAMNVRMWKHAATRRNVALLLEREVKVLDPDEGEMACGEYGPGRLPEPEAILAWLHEHAFPPGPLAGRHVMVTAGPTQEPIDRVRVIANRSSGKQGFAIAGALARLGARVTLVAGPVALATPPGVDRIDVETAGQMREKVMAMLPADAAVLVAAVADWKVEAAPGKLRKSQGPPQLDWQPTPDILAELAASPQRPVLLVGFAAETDDVVASAQAKRDAKGCDWIVANDVSGDTMGGERNRAHLVTPTGVEDWEEAPKAEVARRLAERIAAYLRKG